MARPERPEDAEIRRIVGQNIYEARINLDISQRELALRADLSRPFVTLVEAGDKCPSIRRLVDIAKALDVPAGNLLQSL